MCKEQKSGAWGTAECAMDVLTTFWYKNQSKYMYNSAYHINGDNWSMCCTSLQLSSRIFWILVKFHSNSCRCSDTWQTEQPQLTVIFSESSYFSNSWLNFLLSTRLITTQLIVVNTICHTIYWVSGLSGGWYYWFNPATASTWEFNSTTATISQEKQLEKWVFILYV